MYLDTELEEKASFHRFLRDYIRQRYCPICKRETTMIVIAWVNEEFKEEMFFRCMLCLRLFEEKLEKVEE